LIIAIDYQKWNLPDQSIFIHKVI